MVLVDIVLKLAESTKYHQTGHHLLTLNQHHRKLGFYYHVLAPVSNLNFGMPPSTPSQNPV